MTPSSTPDPRDEQATLKVGTSRPHLSTNKVPIKFTVEETSDEDDEHTIAAKLHKVEHKTERVFKLREDLA